MKDQEELEKLKKLNRDTDFLRYGAEAVGYGGTKEEFEEFQKENKRYRKKKKGKVLAWKQFFILLFLIAFAFLFYWTYQEFWASYDKNPLIDKTSIHYVNDLYASDGRHYEALLDEELKKVYLNWLDNLKEKNISFKLSYDYFKGKDLSEIRRNVDYVYDVLMMDHPELFFLGGYDLEGTSVYDLKINNHFITESKFLINFYEKRLQRKLDDLYHQFKDLESDYAKEMAVYKWIATNSKNNDGVSRIFNTATSALLHKTTNHQGGALASQLIFQRIGINSDYVIGFYEFPRSFNLVYLDDGIYIYDVGKGIETRDKSNMERLLVGLNSKARQRYQIYYLEFEKEDYGLKYLSEF